MKHMGFLFFTQLNMSTLLFCFLFFVSNKSIRLFFRWFDVPSMVIRIFFSCSRLSSSCLAVCFSLGLYRDQEQQHRHFDDKKRKCLKKTWLYRQFLDSVFFSEKNSSKKWFFSTPKLPTRTSCFSQKCV